MLRKSAVILVSILFTALFSTMFFTGCEDSLLTEPAMSESVGPESPMPESPMPGDLGAFGLAKGKPALDTCTTIQDGILLSSTGDTLITGYDEFGYNYQAHLFNGRYCDSDRIPGGLYCDVNLVMKWNDAWLSNRSCDGDSLLDRHYGYPTYSGSGAWVTNHQSGVNPDSSHWTYFVKIVAAPADAYVVDGFWYTSDDTEIGPVIWGAFAVIQRVYNDPNANAHGIEYKSPTAPGFGFYSPSGGP